MPLSAPITLLASASLTLVSSIAVASPYETGSLDAAERFELKTVISGKVEGPERDGVVPSMELAIPARENLELNITMARAVVRDADRVVRSGFADVAMGAKWAIFRQAQNDHAFGLTVEPTLVTPTGADRVSDNAWALEVPITAGRTFGRFALDGGLAYEHVFNSDADELAVSGVFRFDVTEALEIGTELARSASPNDLGASEWRVNLGFEQALSPYLELQGLIGRSLTTADGHHLTQAKLVVEYAFH